MTTTIVATIVKGSHGAVEVNAETGECLQTLHWCDCPDCNKEGYSGIVRFDLNEWHRAYPSKRFADQAAVDILDLGYWTDQDYEPPDLNWRSEFRSEAFYCPDCGWLFACDKCSQVYDRMDQELRR